jgi:hypothetical protein
MKRRAYGRSHAAREIIARYPGKCACCGGAIPAGALVSYYPGRGIAHVGGLDGNSATCAAVLRAAAAYPDPGELAADRWTESHS